VLSPFLYLETMKTKTQTLDGNSLIWAMCLALGQSPVMAATGIAYRSDHGSWVYPRFTSDSEAGELMASEWVSAERPSKGQSTPTWRAVTDSKRPEKPHVFNQVASATGESLGVAVCRAIVLSHCGDTVDVPEQLLAAVPA
jgi:hypothetical protein